VDAVKDISIMSLEKEVENLKEKYEDLEDKLKNIDLKITWGFLAVLVLQIITKVVG